MCFAKRSLNRSGPIKTGIGRGFDGKTGNYPRKSRTCGRKEGESGFKMDRWTKNRGDGQLMR
jgi:hypothetical protein